MIKNVISCAAVAAAFSLVAPHLLMAQNIREATNPALIEKKLRETDILPKSEPLPTFPTPEAQLIDQQKDSIKFSLNAVQFTEGTIFTETQLQEVAAPYVHRETTLGELRQLAEKITLLYRQKGYLLSRAIVPPQEIGAEGTVKIQLIEGYIDTIAYAGEIDELPTLAKNMAEKIKLSKPLRSVDLERYLLLMKGTPGLHVECVMRPSPAQPQASTLTIFVHKKAATGIIGLNNEGSKYIGPHMLHIMGEIHSPFDYGEQFVVNGTLSQPTRRLQSGGLTYNQLIGSEGLKISASGSLTHTRPGEEFRDLNVSGLTKAFTVDLVYPWVRTRTESLYVGGKLNIQNVDTKMLSAAMPSITTDKLRTLTGTLTWDFSDALKGINIVNVEASQGLTFWKATKQNDLNKSRAEGQADALKFMAKLSRLQSLVGHFSIYMRINGQFACNPLLSPERFTYGGTTYFKAYTDYSLTGDHGIEERLELRYSKGSHREGFSSFPVLKFFQPFIYYGHGTIWNIYPSADEYKRLSASELGLGIRLAFIKNIDLNIEFVRPLREKIGNNKNPQRLFFNLTHRF